MSFGLRSLPQATPMVVGGPSGGLYVPRRVDEYCADATHLNSPAEASCALTAYAEVIKDTFC